MKKIATMALAAMLVATTFTACKKYPDGPEFSLLTRGNRLSNAWKVENYKVNGTDFTSLVSSYTETFSKSGAYSYSWGILNGAGTWGFIDNDSKIIIIIII